MTLFKWLRRVLAGTFTFLLLALMVGFIYEQTGRMADRALFSHRVGEAVDIGGRSLNVYCSGQGSPTVILLAGGNGPGYGWSLMQPKIAESTRACWYDPAGVGWSDPPPSPPTSVSMVDDLHEALARAGIAPPFVIVGASIGGEYARVYTHRYPKDVVGLVFVDSSNPDQNEPTFFTSPFNLMSPAKRHLICAAVPFMERFGVMRFIGKRMRGPAPDLSTEQSNLLGRLTAQPKTLRTDAEQTCAATNQGRFVPTGGTGNPELDNAARNSGTLGDRPLLVLTAGRYWAPPGFEKESATYHDVWVHQLQSALVHLSSHGKQVVVDAGHDMEGASDAVLSAVREVVADARTEQRTPNH